MLRLLAGGVTVARSPAAAAALRRLLHIGGGGCGGAGEPESVAYRMSMLRCPSVRKKGLARNSCNLIGRLVAPVSPYEGRSEKYPGAYTSLSVCSSSAASSSISSNFRVTLQLKGDLAIVGLKHLKCNDLVYVSGFLGSYHRVNSNGERDIFYKIYVKELNYVLDQNEKPQNDADLRDSSSTPPVSSQTLKESKYIDRLRLWQVFFTSPYEWWDNRQSKPYANCPDFKHKDTREKLWLQPNDPPWIQKQLELHDLEIAENGHTGHGRRLKNHNWKVQDFEYPDDDDEVQHFASSDDDDMQHSTEA